MEINPPTMARGCLQQKVETGGWGGGGGGGGLSGRQAAPVKSGDRGKEDV